LGNFELYFAIHGLLQTNATVSSFIEDLKDWSYGENFSAQMIEFLAVHFFEIGLSFLSDLPVSVLSQVLHHTALTLKSEDYLLEFIFSGIESRPRFVELLELVEFEFLTKSAIGKFVAWTVDHFDELEITNALWRAITKRLSRTANSGQAVSSRCQSLFRPRAGFPLDGIIAKLTRIHGGNLHERGIVKVSASSLYSTGPGHAAQNAVDMNQQTYFHSACQPNQWLCYDFKGRRIELTDYSVAVSTVHCLRSWVVEGSDDGSTWIVLDERKGNTDTDATHPIVTFSVNRQDSCRFIRLRQTAWSSHCSDYLVIFAFELFGLVDASIL
jgi:hypothetical protein